MTKIPINVANSHGYIAWVKLADWKLNNIEEQRQIKRFHIYRTPILLFSLVQCNFWADRKSNKSIKKRYKLAAETKQLNLEGKIKTGIRTEKRKKEIKRKKKNEKKREKYRSISVKMTSI